MGLGLTVDMNANLVRFEEQINRMSNRLDGFQKHTEGMSTNVNKALGTLGVGISVAGIGAFIKDGLNAADAMNDMADRTGVAVENLAGFQLLAKTADTDIDSIAKSINKLSLFVAKNGDEMKKLGVDAKDPYEAFLQFADVFAAIEDPQRRAALGASVLGKSYADMAPLLLQGSAAIRHQVAEGQKMTGITAESAKAAADLNDKIDTLEKRLASLSSVVVGPIIPGLSNIAERFEYAARKAQGFRDVFTGDFWGNVKSGSDFGLAINKIKEVDGLIEAQQGKIDRIKKHSVLAFIGNYDIGEEEKKLDILIDRRAEAVKKRSMELSPKIEITPEVKIDQGAVDKIMKLGDESEKAGKKSEAAADRAAKAESARNDEIARLVANLQFEIGLTGQSEDRQKRLSEIRGATAKATKTEADEITRLINSKYDLIEADAILAEGEQLAKKQRADMIADYDRLNQKFNGPLLDLNKGIADAMDARAQGIIPDDAKLKVVLDKMGKDYNALTGNAQDAVGQMSEFTVQAAHNMESAFADFLFDPFKDGVEGMGANFGRIIQRMAAEAASAQIFNALLGKNFGAENATGGLLQAGFAGLSSLFGGFFDSGGVSVAAGNSESFSSMMSSSDFWSASVHHDGGVAGRSGKSMSVPASVFAGASRFHSGGWPGLKSDEVPAILQTGERVLSRGEVAASSGSSTVNHVTINVQSGGNDSPEGTGRRIGEAFIRTIAREEINTAARPGNRLNQITQF